MSTELLSVDDIAELLSEPTHRVAYAIKKQRIKHVKRIGLTRVFEPSVVSLVKEVIFDMQCRR